MQSIHRLKKNKEFRRVFRLGKSIANKEFVVYIFNKTNASHARLGVSVSKRVGNAVVRNKIKRLTKEIMRDRLEKLSANIDIVVIARNPAAGLDYVGVTASINRLWAKLNIR